MLFVMLRFLWFDLNLVSDLVQQAFETEISEKIWDDNGMTYTGAQAQKAKRAKLSACGQYLVQIVYGAICTHKTDTLLRRLAVRGSQVGVRRGLENGRISVALGSGKSGPGWVILLISLHITILLRYSY